MQDLFIDPRTGEGYSLEDILTGYQKDESSPTLPWMEVQPGNTKPNQSNLETELSKLVGGSSMQTSNQDSTETTSNNPFTRLGFGSEMEPRDKAKENWMKNARNFDALSGLGTAFSSGLKLRRGGKRFSSGQSSLFIQ